MRLPQTVGQRLCVTIWLDDQAATKSDGLIGLSARRIGHRLRMQSILMNKIRRMPVESMAGRMLSE